MDNKTSLKLHWEMQLKNCTKCRLSINRTQVVPGEGNSNASMMIIGQNPGFNEDQQGKPFIGKSGVKLNELLYKLNIDRNDVYVTNIVKCFTPANRTPELDELKACEPHLKFEIDTIRPKVIIALGDPAIPTLTGFKGTVTKAINSDLFFTLNYNNQKLIIPVIACYHPSYLCRNEHTSMLDSCVKIISAKLKKIQNV